MIFFDILVVLWRGIFVMSLPGLPGPNQLDVLLLLMSFHKYMRSEFICFISFGESTLANDDEDEAKTTNWLE